MAGYSGNGGTLAQTGAGIALFGTTIYLQWVIGVIVGVVIIGALTYRMANRRRRYQG